MTYPKTQSSHALLSAKGISLRLSEKTILDNVELVVNPSELVTIIGPNGAGKTTLLKIMLGILRPSHGEITKKPGLKFGYVPQKTKIDPIFPITVNRFLRFGNAKLGMTFIKQQLEEVGIPHLGDQYLHTLSGGEFQRTILARALLRNPDILFLDEPAQGVDPSGQYDLYRLISNLKNKNGCSIVLISHDLHLVLSATDRVICLDRHVCCSGKPDKIIQDPAYQALFGPEEAKRLATYTHHHLPSN